MLEGFAHEMHGITRAPNAATLATPLATATASNSIVSDVSPGRLRRHFSVDSEAYRVSKSVRDSILFSVHNALRDPPFTRLNLICCRNLLIYLDRTAQLQLLKTFYFALEPGGVLFLGNSESADGAHDLSDISMPERDGYWLIGEIRKTLGDTELPAVAVSGLARKSDKDRTAAAGFDSTVSKPINFQMLATEIRRLKR